MRRAEPNHPGASTTTRTQWYRSTTGTNASVCRGLRGSRQGHSIQAHPKKDMIQTGWESGKGAQSDTNNRGKRTRERPEGACYCVGLK